MDRGPKCFRLGLLFLSSHTVSLYSKTLFTLRTFFKQASHLDIQNIGDLDTIIGKRTKNLVPDYTHDDDHFINDFLPKLPSGRYRAIQLLTAWGKDSFLRAMVVTLNNGF